MERKADQWLPGAGVEGGMDYQGAQETFWGHGNVCPLNVAFMSMYI